MYDVGVRDRIGGTEIGRLGPLPPPGLIASSKKLKQSLYKYELAVSQEITLGVNAKADVPQPFGGFWSG